MAAPILERIQKADNLPTLPAVAIQVLEMTRADDLSVTDIAEVIQQDPALTGKLLRVVNSSLFGMARQVSSLPQAMVVLGLRTVKVMVLSFSLVDLSKQYKRSGFDYPLYWRRSLTTAVSARLLADHVRKNLAEELFVAGLLCDIGALAAIQFAPELYQPVVDLHGKKTIRLHVAEQQQLGLTHEEISALLLQRWSLPNDLCEAVRTHHHALSDPPHGHDAPAVLALTLRAAALLADVFVSDVDASYLPRISQELTSALSITAPELDRVLKELDTHVKQVASLFAIDIGQTLSYQDIHATAASQLADLTMEAELNAQRLAKQNRTLAHQAATDGLTGIANRAALDERLAAACKRCRDEQIPIGLILLDLDRFKQLNDIFGHSAGDEALRQVGRLLKEFQTENRFPARYGGEEFAVVVENMSTAELRTLAEELRLGVSRLRIICGSRHVPFTTSVGAAHMKPGEPNLSSATLLERADTCLYQAKSTGRNRVMCAGSRRVSESDAETEPLQSA